MAASVRDLWTKKNPDKTSRTTRVHSARWGIGKRWQVVWTEAGVPVSETFTTKDAAEEFAAGVVVKQTEGTWITKDKKAVTLADMWDLWIPTKSDKAKSTLDNYNSTWRRINGQFGDRPCHTLGRAEISTWIASLTTTKGVKPGDDPRPLGDAAKRLAGIVMKALLDLAAEERVILHNPMKSKDLPTQKPSERRYLTVEEVDRLFAAADGLDEAAAAREREAADGDQGQDTAGAIDEDEPADPRIRTAVELLVRTGVRPGEAFGFRVGDLAAGRGRLRVQRDVDDLG
ncbi:tyrosine-type recombinase/integrase, partial [uncultured Corynebacterium sp.]|uniref:tyrosine-type recombinase/integrase n=1 Tax=uncultured Corynebacterium sp. TaxID=159447 RepID=UPI00345BA4FF